MNRFFLNGKEYSGEAYYLVGCTKEQFGILCGFFRGDLGSCVIFLRNEFGELIRDTKRAGRRAVIDNGVLTLV